MEIVLLLHLSGRHTDCCLALFCIYKRKNVLESFLLFFFFSPQACFYLLIFDCSGSLLLQVGFYPVVAGQGCCLAVGHFCFRAWAVGLIGFSSCGSQAPERRLNTCGAQAPLLGGIWYLPGSGIEPMSPALGGGFFTSEQPGKPPKLPTPSCRVLIFSSVKPMNSFAFQVQSIGFLPNWSEVHKFGI